MNILALDLGTKMGLCYGDSRDNLEVRTVKLAKDSEVREWGQTGLIRRKDPRVERLYEHLKRRYLGFVDVLVFEDVQFGSTTYQSHLWASFRAAMWIAFRKARVKILAVPVGTLKKFWTGSGNADKQAMKSAAQRRSLSCEGWDDNSVDAVALWHYAYETCQ